MFVFITLLCPAVFALVSANPLLQALAQQACPVQNFKQNLPVCHQPHRNINNYVQQPNQPPCPCSQNPTNQVDQRILNKVLASPTLRTILDPNTKLFNQNGLEIPRQVPNNCNTGCTGTVPNVINNYIIVPPELLLNEPNREASQDNHRNHNRGRNEIGSRRNKEDIPRKIDRNTRSENRGQRSQNQRETRRNRQRQLEPGRDECERDISDIDYLEHDRNRHKSRNRQDERRREKNKDSNRSRQNERAGQHADRKQKEYTEKLGNENRREQVTNSNINVANLTHVETSKAKERVFSNEVKRSTPDGVSNDQIVVKTKVKPKSCVQKEIPTTTKEHVENTHKVPNKIGNVKLDLQPNINSYPGYSEEEAVIQDIRRKFPALPENVVRNLLSHMKRQLQNNQMGSNAYYPSFPVNYDQLYSTQSPSLRPSNINNNRNKNGRRRSGSSRNRKRKNQVNNCGSETTVELAPTIYVEDPVAIEPTTEQTIEKTSDRVTTVALSIESTTVGTENAVDYTTTPKNDIETTTPSTLANKIIEPEQVDDLYDRTAIPELGSEDVVPTIHMNGIADDYEYYPDFSADNHAYAFSHEQIEATKILDDRYHYTTDKNIKMEELNRERRKYETGSQNLSNHLSKHDRNNNYEKQTEKIDLISFSDEIEATIQKPTDIGEESEEIEFRSPPFLEEPDFETKPVNKDFFSTQEPYYYHGYEPKDKYAEVTDKASVYSNSKTPKFIIKEKKKPRADIETVYASSKVVKFGQTAEKAESEDFSIEAIKSNRNMFSVDGDTTFVFANSYPDTN